LVYTHTPTVVGTHYVYDYPILPVHPFTVTHTLQVTHHIVWDTFTFVPLTHFVYTPHTVTTVYLHITVLPGLHIYTHFGFLPVATPHLTPHIYCFGFATPIYTHLQVHHSWLHTGPHTLGYTYLHTFRLHCVPITFICHLVPTPLPFTLQDPQDPGPRTFDLDISTPYIGTATVIAVGLHFHT